MSPWMYMTHHSLIIFNVANNMLNLSANFVKKYFLKHSQNHSTV